jgi:hypothetical protein
MDARAKLETVTFTFIQEANCHDGGEIEELIIEAKSSLGIDNDGGAFYVIKTEQWAIDGTEEIRDILKRVENAIDSMQPTTIHKNN